VNSSNEDRALVPRLECAENWKMFWRQIARMFWHQMAGSPIAFDPMGRAISFFHHTALMLRISSSKRSLLGWRGFRAGSLALL